MKKIILLSIFFFSILISGCTSVSVSPEKIINENILHKQCEENKCFIASYHYSGVNIGDNVSLLIQTDGKEVHLIDYLGTTELNPSQILFYENPTISNKGDLVNSYDLQRNNPQNSTAEVYSNPTISNFGTLINQNYLFGDRKRTEGFSEINHFILKSNTTYLLTFVSEQNSNEVLLKFRWYEE